MAVIIPQVVTEDRASGALVVDGSLKFQSDKSTHLQRTQVGGNRRTFTWSAWVKKGQFNAGASDSHDWFSASEGDTTAGSDYGFGVRFPYYTGHSSHSDQLMVFEYENGAFKMRLISEQVFRDHGEFYHIVIAVDTTIASPDSDRVKVYINGERITAWKSGYESYPSQNLELTVSESGKTSQIGCSVENGSTLTQLADGYASNFYLIDGQQLGPEEFGYTDPLTNTWRPKKAEISGPNDGTIWSSYLTSSTSNFYTGAQGVEKAFDGDTSTYVQQIGGVNPNYITFTPSGGIAHNSTVEVWINNAANEVSYNGGSLQSISSGWNTIATGSGTLTSIRVERPSTSGAAFGAIRIDGVILIDGDTSNMGTDGFYLPMDGNSLIGQDQSGRGNDWTPVNFGGSTDITKATGARPILNTLGGTVARSGVLGSEVSKYYTILGTSGGGNPYIFEDLGNRPQLSFIRGATYTFDWSAASSHPLRFATAADAAGSTEYTDGTDVTGNVTTITVPHNAPDTLYYYCNVHGGMGNSISVTTDETKADPYAWKCVFAAPLVGNDDDVSNQINCTSTTKAITTSGAAADSSDSNFYGGSYVFDGGNDYIKTDANSADFNFGSGDFTLECWINADYGSSISLFSLWDYQNSQRSWNLYLNSERVVLITSTDGSGQSDAVGPTANTKIKLNKWTHVAVTKESNTYRCFIDGDLKESNSVTETIYNNTNDPIYIGATNGVTEWFNGHMQDVRIYKGVAKYTSDFIPASTSPDILPDTPSGVAIKSQLTKITDGAVSFGTEGTDNMIVAESADFGFGTGDWTVEGYFYVSESGSNRVLWDLRNGASTYYFLRLSGTSAYIFQYGGSTTTFSAPDNTWNHIAISRSSSTTKIFVNGIETNSFSDSTNGSTGTLQLSTFKDTTTSSSDYGFGGQLSNFRIVKGTALYTSNFTPPSAPLTNVTNTVLLCCQSNEYSGHYTVCPTPGGINDGDIWSDSTLTITTAGTTETGTLGAVFNATTGTTGAVDSFGYLNGAFDFTWTPRAAIPYTNKVEVWTGYGGNVSLNGGSNVSTANNNWTELVSGSSGNITSIRFTTGSGGGWWSGVRVDDVMLVDPIFTNGQVKSTNFNPFNTDINTVRGREGSYATLNPLISTVSLSDGNLKQAQTSGTWNVAVSSIPMSTGKWYCEVTLVGGNTFQMGIIKLDDGPNWAANFPLVDFPYGWGMVVDSVAKLRSDYITQLNGRTDVEYNSTAPVAGDTIGMAYNADTQALTFYVNGRSYGDTTSYWSYPPTPGEYVFGNSVVTGTDAVWNFGQKPFKFPPPDGFQPLTSSTVRPDTVIARPDQYVSATLYTGDNNSSQDIDVGFAPDLVWQKIRSQAGDHALTDTVRGISGGYLQTEDTDAQKGNANDGISAFLPNGFRAYNSFNNNGLNWVSWCWKAGGSSNIFNIDDVGYATAAAAGLSASGNSWDSDPTGASIGTKQGFSIIKHSGTGSAGSLPHGLTQKPDLLITKAYNGTTGNWNVYTDLFDGSNDYMYLNTNAHKGDSSLSAFTSELFYYGYTANDYIHYLWHSVPGLQKFGVYTGNSSTNFVSLDFRPALIWVKRAVANSSADTTTNNSAWTIMDSARLSYNGLTPNHLYANWNVGEGKRGNSTSTSTLADMTLEPVSNGFYLNGPATETNSSTGTFLYCAWAEAPAFNLYGATSNAR